MIINFFGYSWNNIFYFLLGPFSLFLFLYGILDKSKKKYFILSISIFLFIIFVINSHKSEKITLSYYNNQKYVLEDIEENIQQIIKNENKPMILYFYADWCHSCKELENRLTLKEIGELITQGWVIVLIDVTNYDKYKDYIFKKYGVFGIPALSFIDNQGNLIKPFTLVGSEIPKGTLISILRQFGNFSIEKNIRNKN